MINPIIQWVSLSKDTIKQPVAVGPVGLKDLVWKALLMFVRVRNPYPVMRAAWVLKIIPTFSAIPWLKPASLEVDIKFQ